MGVMITSGGGRLHRFLEFCHHHIDARGQGLGLFGTQFFGQVIDIRIEEGFGQKHLRGQGTDPRLGRILKVTE